jgi:beta-galactosidase
MLHPVRLRTSVCCLVLCTLASAAFATSVVPAEKESVRSLNGQWRFKLEQPGDVNSGLDSGKLKPIVSPAKPEAFQTLDYKEDSSWHDLGVPGNWEMAGYSPATYNNPDNAIGLYRLSFAVPAEWQGRIVKLNFDGVQNGAEVFCNGQPVNVDEASWGRPNYHEGGNTAFQADLTPTVKFGGKNLLAIRVTKNTKSSDMDSGDFFFLGGIHRPVTLFSVPKMHVEDLTVQTKLLPESKAELRVILALAASQAGAKAVMQLESQPAVEAKPDGQGRVELVQTLEKPRLWSAEKPNLYTLTVDMKDEKGRVVEHLVKRIGVREVSIKDGILLVNNVPVKLAGICRHDCYPTLGTAINEEVWRKDITLMKAANINAIRTSHYPYGSGFYDLCDEMGMYVADEMSAGWVPTNTDELTPAFAQHARETVRRDKNHPCVIIWAVGNENKPGKNNKVAADEMKKLDPTRPRLISWRKAEEGDVEFDDAHYTNPADIAKANAETERRQKYPKIYLENPNDWEIRNGADYGCTDLWAAIIKRTWQEVLKGDHIPGTFLWEWQDRAVADGCKTKLYDYVPATGINYVKAKGICDGFRNPRPWYYHVKVAYAPIQLVPPGLSAADLPSLGGRGARAPELHAAVTGSTASVKATNYYSFTDLSELNTTWRLLKSDKELKTGVAHPTLAPRATGDIKFELPSDALAEADALRLDFDHPDGRNVATYLLRIKPEADTTPKLDTARLDGIKFPRFNFVSMTYGKNPNTGWRWIERHPAKLVNISVQKAGSSAPTSLTDDAALYAMPLAEVGAMDADVVLADDTKAKVAGHVRADFAGGQFSYSLKWKVAKVDVQELGWVLEMPKKCDHFSWHRQAYWSYYPATHIGRPAGTATPDSADAEVTKVTRPDAFDFNSTKYNCDWASLADASGRGLAVAFTPDARQHCRAGTDGNGDRLLVVNAKCCPPRDISSGIVPDYYFMLERGKQATGGFRLGTIAR